jgi:uncharacterized lipoprotein YmbA
MTALCLLTACASVPKINYYTLDMEPSGGIGSTVNLTVEQVRTTDALSRSEILVQASPTRIEYYATDQWVGGVAELVGQKLQAEFGSAVEGRRTLAVAVMVLACEQVDGSGGAVARMKLSVTIRDPAEKRYKDALLEKTYEASLLASHSTAGAVVEALSVCAERLAAEIAADAATL